MKKLFALLLSFAVLFALSACAVATPGEDETNPDLVQLNQWANQLDIPSEVTEDITLPNSVGEASVIWSSSNPNILSQQGVVTRPGVDVGDVTVTLTATIQWVDFERNLNIEVVRDFAVLVKAISQEDADMIELFDTFQTEFEIAHGDIEDDIVLPTTFGEVDIVWTSNRPNNLSPTGEVSQPLSFDGVVNVTLTATIYIGENYSSKSFPFRVMPLDEETSIVILTNNITNTLNSTVGAISEVTGDIPLQRSIHGRSIQWQTSSPNLVSRGGYVSLPLASEGPQEVTLTARFTVAGEETVLEYTFDVVPRDSFAVTSSVNVPFTNLADEYIVEDGFIDVFYVNDRALPYVDIESFIWLIEGAIVSSDLIIEYGENSITVKYEVIYEPEEGEEESLYDDIIFEFTADFEANTVTVNRFGFFSSIAQATQTDFGSDLYTIDYIYNESDPVVFDLTYYSFELLRDEDNFLMPLHLANLFFTGSMFDVYYNHDSIYGVDTYQISTPSIQNTLNSSSKNGELMSRDLLEDTFNFLVFTFDHFFGLRIAEDVESYYNRFEGRRGSLMNESDMNAHYTAVMRTAYDLDDLHTSHSLVGYYMSMGNFNSQVQFSWFGQRTTHFYDALDELRSSCLNDDVNFYEDDKVAIVTVSGFNVDTPDTFKEHLEEAEARGAEKVIVDLSCNTGGIIGTMLQVIGYMTDEPIAYHSINAGDGSTSSSFIGTENEAFDFEWYVLTSPVTYSAANLMTSIVKDMGIAQIIGMQSSGGASSITTNILPSGTILIMSSPTVLANENYESIEFGIPVDRSFGLHRIKDHAYIAQQVAND